jgi:hypothetical protein
MKSSQPAKFPRDPSLPGAWVPSYFLIVFALLFGAVAMTVQSCQATAGLAAAYSTPEKRQAIGKALLADAGAILSDAALRALSGAVQQAAAGGEIDFAHAAAGAMYAQVSAGNIRKVVLDATGGSLPKLADTAAQVVRAEIANGTGEQAAIVAVADAISGNAMSTPGGKAGK